MCRKGTHLFGATVKATTGEQLQYAVNFDKQTQPVNITRLLNATSFTVGWFYKIALLDLTAENIKRFDRKGGSFACDLTKMQCV